MIPTGQKAFYNPDFSGESRHPAKTTPKVRSPEGFIAISPHAASENEVDEGGDSEPKESSKNQYFELKGGGIFISVTDPCTKPFGLLSIQKY